MSSFIALLVYTILVVNSFDIDGYDNFRMVAEYEEVSAILLNFPVKWLNNTEANKMYIDMIELITDYGDAQIWMNNDIFINKNNIESDNIMTLNCNCNSAWTRDYGPISILNKYNNQLLLVDMKYDERIYDNNYPICLSKFINIPCVTINNIRFDGGNLLITNNQLFMTKITYYWNQNNFFKRDLSNKSMIIENGNKIIKKIFNVDKIHSFNYVMNEKNEPLDGTGHIDMFVKIINNNTIIVSSIFNEIEPFHSVFKETMQYLNKMDNYKIYEIDGYYNETTNIWYTFTNSLIVNDLIIIPFYDDLKKNNLDYLNDNAFKIYQKAAPNKIIKSIASDFSIKRLGSIHCLTQSIPKDASNLAKFRKKSIDTRLQATILLIICMSLVIVAIFVSVMLCISYYIKQNEIKKKV